MSRKTAIEKPRPSARTLTAIAAVLGATLIAAAPASAGDEFGRGFEHEMGRIMAHTVAGAGFGFLHAVAYPPVVVHHAPPVVHRTVVHHGPPVIHRTVVHHEYRGHPGRGHYKQKHHARWGHRGHYGRHDRGRHYERRVVYERGRRY